MASKSPEYISLSRFLLYATVSPNYVVKPNYGNEIHIFSDEPEYVLSTNNSALMKLENNLIHVKTESNNTVSLVLYVHLNPSQDDEAAFYRI